MNSDKNRKNSIWTAVLPMFLYTVIYQGTGLFLVFLTEELARMGGASGNAFLSNHYGDIMAVLGAAAMAVSFLLIWKIFPGELRFSGTIHCRGDRTAAAAAGAIVLSLFLNAVLSASGFIALDPGAEAASEQTAAVSLPLGILVYGVLTPVCEESVFRGITLNRIYHLLSSRFANDADPSPAHSDSERSGPVTIAAQRVDDPIGEPAGTDFASGCRKGRSTGHKSDRTTAGKTGIDCTRLFAILITAALFGIYHGNIVQGVFAFCMGTAFGFFLLMTESLPAVMVLHGAINTVTLLISGTNLYNTLCETPAWMAALLAVSVLCAFYTVHTGGQSE